MTPAAIVAAVSLAASSMPAEAAAGGGPRIFVPSDARQPAPDTTLKCSPSSTANMTYHNGSVMHTVTTYTIFWSPNATITAGYRNLINRYFQDIGGSAFYNINTQYYQNPGPVYMLNSTPFGGTWLDTVNAYPGGRGTGTNPLTDQDIRDEVTRALAANPSWGPPGLDREYFVYTERGIESKSGNDCTGGVTCTGVQYCAYHWDFTSGTDRVIYANMPYDGTWGNCGRGNIFVSPNANLDADIEISTSSHEHFEASTDPLGDGWFDCDTSGEDGDKCAYRYGTTQTDGHNVVLNGNPYIVQQEWSNAAFDGTTAFGGCATRYLADVDMAVAKSASPEPVDTGGTLTYAIDVKNLNATFEGTDVALGEFVPAGTTFAGLTSPVGWSCVTPSVGSTGSVACSTLSVPKGAAASFSFRTTVSCALADGAKIGNTVSITSTSSDKNSANDSASTTTTAHNPPPAITCPAPVTAECSSHCGTPASQAPIPGFLAGATATDNCPGTTIANNAPACFPVGVDPVTFTATDSGGAASSCSAAVTVKDTKPPTITVSLDRKILWPPNHKLVPVQANVKVGDICDPNPTFKLVSITSNEPDNGLGDGDTAGDIQGAAFGTADTSFFLRAERSGKGRGRVYTIRYRVTDASANSSDAVATVAVPHNR